MIENILRGTDRMLTVAEFASIVRVGVANVRNMIRAGKIPAYRIGERGQYLIAESFVRDQFSKPIQP